MGYNVCIFVEEVDENLLCGVCSNVLEQPVLTPCGNSFCLYCLHTWLSRPGCTSCPVCRGIVCPADARPIHSIRNLINALAVNCDNIHLGCNTVTTLEQRNHHLAICPHIPIITNNDAPNPEVLNVSGERTANEDIFLAGNFNAAEGFDINGDHLVAGEGSSWPRLTGEEAGRRLTGEEAGRTSRVSNISLRVTTLEMQLNRMQLDLDMADFKNRRLERELEKTRDDITDKRHKLIENQTCMYFLPRYTSELVPKNISKLSTFISRYLFDRPPYLDENEVFDTIRKYCDEYLHQMGDYQHDVRILLITAYSCNWFNQFQKRCLKQWLYL